MYIFDYGAPTGLGLALTHGDRISATISQNGNAYEKGFGDAWRPVREVMVGADVGESRSFTAGDFDVVRDQMGSTRTGRRTRRRCRPKPTPWILR
jgi:hypothetical protein